MLVTIGYIDYRQKAIFLKILMRFGFYSNMKSQVLWARILYLQEIGLFVTV